MGLIDNYTKKYMSDNKVFADAFNFYLYDGEQIINADDLQSIDTTAVATLDNVQLNTSVQKIRDNYKILAVKEDEVGVYVVLGVENEAEINYAEPVKSMVYDALEYARQVAEKAKKHKQDNDTKGISPGEFMRGFHKDDRLVPVVTLVIFFNPEKWDAPKSIHEMFDVKDKRLLSYVNDYKLNLISPYEIKETDASKFQSNLKEVLLYIKNSNDKNKLQELVNGDEEFTKLDRDAACVINVCTNSKLKINENEGVVNVCKAINDLVTESIDEGKYIGAIGMCKTFKLSLEDAILKIMESFNLSEQEADAVVNKYW